MATMPEAPPATMPSEAVGRSSSVTRASTMPAPIVTSSVAALTSVTGSQCLPRSLSVELCRKVPRPRR